MEDSVLTCQTNFFTLGKLTILCNSEHNNSVQSGSSAYASNTGTSILVRGDSPSSESKCSVVVPTKGFRFVGPIVQVGIHGSMQYYITLLGKGFFLCMCVC